MWSLGQGGGYTLPPDYKYLGKPRKTSNNNFLDTGIEPWSSWANHQYNLLIILMDFTRDTPTMALNQEQPKRQIHLTFKIFSSYLRFNIFYINKKTNGSPDGKEQPL